MTEYYCPRCQADLQVQSDFNPENDYYTCPKCGILLLNPGSRTNESNRRFKNIRWFCDDCNASLNDQPGFTDFLSEWKCTVCDHLNLISEEQIRSGFEEYEHVLIRNKGITGIIVDIYADDSGTTIYAVEADYPAEDSQGNLLYPLFHCLAEELIKTD